MASNYAVITHNPRTHFQKSKYVSKYPNMNPSQQTVITNSIKTILYWIKKIIYMFAYSILAKTWETSSILPTNSKTSIKADMIYRLHFCHPINVCAIVVRLQLGQMWGNKTAHKDKNNQSHQWCYLVKMHIPVWRKKLTKSTGVFCECSLSENLAYITCQVSKPSQIYPDL